MSYNEIAAGTVKYVNGPNDYGFYSVKIDGHDKSFGMGKKAPSCKVGDVVELNYKLNTKGYPEADFKSLRVVSAQQAAFNASPKQLVDAAVKYAANPASKEMSKDDYWRRREERDVMTQNEIRLQASRNSAVAFMDFLVKNGLMEIPTPTAKNRTKADSAKLFLDKLTDQFYKDTVAVNEKAQDTKTPATDANDNNGDTF